MSYGVHRRGGAATAQVGAWLYSTWVELEELHADFLDFAQSQTPRGTQNNHRKSDSRQVT
mgnify:CR=1 FL=1